MKNKDIIQRFIFEEAPVRGELVRLDNSFQTIMQQHDYPTFIRKILGEALAVVNLLAATIKFKGRLTLQFQGKGSLKLLLAQCTHEFHFRGLAQWIGELDETEILNSLKNGVLAIIIDPQAAEKQRYQGIVNWSGNSLAESIEGYFRDSEQLPTRLWLAVNETSVSGLLLQILPKDSNDNNDWEHIIHLSETIKPEELLQCDNATILQRLYHQEEVRVFEPVAVDFRCTCSEAKSENALLLLGQEEAEEELHNKQKILVTCEFCNKEFVFDKVDVAKIFKKGDNSSTSVH